MPPFTHPLAIRFSHFTFRNKIEELIANGEEQNVIFLVNVGAKRYNFNMDERRQHMRINDALDIKHWPWKNLFVSSSVSENISAGGMCFPALQRLEPKLRVGLNIYLPEFKDPVTLAAEVVWLCEINNFTYRFKVGVKFLEMSMTHKARLLHHLCSKLQEQESSQSSLDAPAT